MRLDINLASRPYEDARQFWVRSIAGIGLLSILTLVLLYSVVSGWLQARQSRILIDKGERQIASLDHERMAKEALLNRAENRSTRDRSEFLNALFLRKAFSWTKVFEELEKVMPPRLHVVSIKPEMSADNQLQVKLVVAGESRERALELVHRMETSQHFQQTQIVVENFAPSGKPGDSVQFDITAIYVPETQIAANRGPR